MSGKTGGRWPGVPHGERTADDGCGTEGGGWVPAGLPGRRGYAGAEVVHAVERLVGVERRVLRELGSIESTVLDTALPRLSRAADHGVLWVVIAGGLAVSGPSGRRAAVRGLAALSLASVTTNVLVKRATGRRRPPAGLVPAAREPRRVPFTTSFPSGHAASAAAFTTAVALELPATAIPLAPLAFAVAASRVVMGVHYPSDVIAGIALGMVAAGVTRRGLRDGWPAQERRERDRDRD